LIVFEAGVVMVLAEFEVRKLEQGLEAERRKTGARR
jgi:hypothetical protein